MGNPQRSLGFSLIQLFKTESQRQSVSRLKKCVLIKTNKQLGKRRTWEHLHLGQWKWRPSWRRLQLRRLRQQYLHAQCQFDHRKWWYTVVQRIVCSNTGFHSQQRLLRSTENSNLRLVGCSDSPKQQHTTERIFVVNLRVCVKGNHRSTQQLHRPTHRNFCFCSVVGWRYRVGNGSQVTTL